VNHPNIRSACLRVIEEHLIRPSPQPPVRRDIGRVNFRIRIERQYEFEKGFSEGGIELGIVIWRDTVRIR
jgi:hypothetical protein